MKKRRRLDNDVDYHHKLNDDEKAWLRAFDQEYCYANKSGYNLHTKEQMREIDRQRKKEKYDVCNPLAREAAYQASKNASHKRPYGPEDYMNVKLHHQKPESTEDFLITILDEREDEKTVSKVIRKKTTT